MFTSQSKEGDDGQRGAVNAQRATLSPPSIALPQGGGAMRGIGEKFAANPVTGTGAITVPVATSPGRAGFGLQLSLSYPRSRGRRRKGCRGIWMARTRCLTATCLFSPALKT